MKINSIGHDEKAIQIKNYVDRSQPNYHDFDTKAHQYTVNISNAVSNANKISFGGIFSIFTKNKLPLDPRIKELEKLYIDPEFCKPLLELKTSEQKDRFTADEIRELYKTFREYSEAVVTIAKLKPKSTPSEIISKVKCIIDDSDVSTKQALMLQELFASRYPQETQELYKIKRLTPKDIQDLMPSLLKSPENTLKLLKETNRSPELIKFMVDNTKKDESIEKAIQLMNKELIIPTRGKRLQETTMFNDKAIMKLYDTYKKKPAAVVELASIYDRVNDEFRFTAQDIKTLVNTYEEYPEQVKQLANFKFDGSKTGLDSDGIAELAKSMKLHPEETLELVKKRTGYPYHKIPAIVDSPYYNKYKEDVFAFLDCLSYRYGKATISTDDLYNIIRMYREKPEVASALGFREVEGDNSSNYYVLAGFLHGYGTRGYTKPWAFEKVANIAEDAIKNNATERAIRKAQELNRELERYRAIVSEGM